jgi:hypothetical protein
MEIRKTLKKIHTELILLFFIIIIFTAIVTPYQTITNPKKQSIENEANKLEEINLLQKKLYSDSVTIDSLQKKLGQQKFSTNKK